MVVDFGTSTNVDVISAKGEFLGGVFAPGIEISVDALAARAAALRKVELVRPRSVIGKNTVECLQSGIIYGFAGQVDGLVRRIVDELERTDPRRRGHGHRHRRARAAGGGRVRDDRGPPPGPDAAGPAAGVRAQHQVRPAAGRSAAPAADHAS